jgi:hypothetical protein
VGEEIIKSPGQQWPGTFLETVMGKRSDFEHRELAYYPTPVEAVRPLLPHLPGNVTFCEPCAGAGVLVRHLEDAGHNCLSAFDVSPRTEGIYIGDASFIGEKDVNGCAYIITNPPWERTVLHQIIERCSTLRPTWLLFDADWMHTKQATPYLEICQIIVSVGRVKWIEGSAGAGKDNACWYLFSKGPRNITTFWGRQ